MVSRGRSTDLGGVGDKVRCAKIHGRRWSCRPVLPGGHTACDRLRCRHSSTSRPCSNCGDRPAGVIRRLLIGQARQGGLIRPRQTWQRSARRHQLGRHIQPPVDRHALAGLRERFALRRLEQPGKPAQLLDEDFFRNIGVNGDVAEKLPSMDMGPAFCRFQPTCSSSRANPE
jgi:hypothetical protein